MTQMDQEQSCNLIAELQTMKVRYSDVNEPLKLAIAQIVGTMPPFDFAEAYRFADLPVETQNAIEGWCSVHIASTEYGCWMTGSSIVDAAEILVKLAVEGANITEQHARPLQ